VLAREAAACVAIFTKHTYGYWHSGAKICTVRPDHCVLQVAPGGDTRSKIGRSSLIPFRASRTVVIAMKYRIGKADGSFTAQTPALTEIG
jgi:hypothetical protein